MILHFNESSFEIQTRGAGALCLCALLALAGCESVRFLPAPTLVPSKVAPPATVESAVLRQASWNELPQWQEENPALVWEPFLRSCSTLRSQEGWREVCTAAESAEHPDPETARRFFERNFTPFQLSSAGGGEEGLITGYYEPLLNGSRNFSARYRFPVFSVPDDLLVIDLAELYPELKGLRLRGRLDGRRVVPYYDRAQIDQGQGTFAGKQLVWVDDPIELFFLQIQGSGRITLDTGEIIRVGFADQNGHPYRSVGRLLAERGELPLEKTSMQSIKKWAKQNPDKLAELLNHNASYVFFRELPIELPGPLGALGVPLTARRSVAVDARFVPLGAPVYIATTWPLSSRPLSRLMLAQDTGGAIRGAVRADFFWGFGEEAAYEAGRMKQPLRMWVLLPNDTRLSGSQE